MRHYWVYKYNTSDTADTTDMADTTNTSDEIAMIESNLETMRRAIEGIDEIIATKETMPAWVLDKIAVTKSMLNSVWEYLEAKKSSQKEAA